MSDLEKKEKERQNNLAEFDRDYRTKNIPKPTMKQNFTLCMILVFSSLCLVGQIFLATNRITQPDGSAESSVQHDPTFVGSDNRYTTPDGRLSFEIPVGFEVHPEVESIFQSETITMGLDRYLPLEDMKTRYTDLATELALNFGLSSFTDYDKMESIRLGGATGSYADFMFFDGRYEWIMRSIFHMN